MCEAQNILKNIIIGSSNDKCLERFFIFDNLDPTLRSYKTFSFKCKLFYSLQCETILRLSNKSTLK